MRLSGKFKTTHSTKVTGFKLALFWALPYHWARLLYLSNPLDFSSTYLRASLPPVTLTVCTIVSFHSSLPISSGHLMLHSNPIFSTWRAIIYTPLATLMMPLPCLHAALFLKAVFRNLHLGHTLKFFVLTKYKHIAYLNFSVRLSSFYHNFHLTFWTLKLVY